MKELKELKIKKCMNQRYLYYKLKFKIYHPIIMIKFNQELKNKIHLQALSEKIIYDYKQLINN